MIVRYGWIGRSDQALRKPFPDAAAAQHHMEKLIHEKIGKGYVEVSC